MRFFHFSGVLFLAFTLALAGASGLYAPNVSASRNADVITGKASKIRDFKRLTFDWQEPVYLTATTTGNTLTIRFEKPAKTDMAQAAEALGDAIQSYKISADGRTITCILNGEYRVRSFVSGNTNGVDLFPADNLMADTEVSSNNSASRTANIKKNNLKEWSKNTKNNTTKDEALEAVLVDMENIPDESLSELEPAAAKPITPKPDEKKLTPEEEAAAKLAEENKPSLDPEKIKLLQDATERSKEAEERAKIEAENREKERLAALEANKNGKPANENAAKVAPKIQMTDAEALAAASAQKSAEQAALESAGSQIQTGMSDAEALKLINQQREKALKAAIEKQQINPAQHPSASTVASSAKEAATSETPSVAAESSTPEPSTTPQTTTNEVESAVAGDVAAQAGTATTSAAPAGTTQAAPAPDEKLPTQETTPAAPAGTTTPVAAAEVTPVPTASTATAATPPPAAEVSIGTAQTTDPQQAIALPSTESQPASETAPPIAATEATAKTNSTTTEATPTENAENASVASADEVSTAQGLRIRASLNNEVLTMTFPWLERTAVAAFVRNELAWIIFDHEAKLDVSEVNNLLRAGTSITQLKMPGITAFYMPVPIGNGIKVENIPGTFKWVVHITPSRQSAAKPLDLTINTDPTLPSHILLPLLEFAPGIKITDPIIGDTLEVIPVYDEGVGVSPTRNFIDFSMLETSQGVAIQYFTDSVIVEPVRNGVRVSTEKGANISPNLPKPSEVKENEKNKTSKVLFPYAEWQVSEDKDVNDEIRELERAIVAASSKSDISIHQRIAELYLGQGKAVEALGYLNNIKRINPEAYIDRKLSALHGAANFLLQRYTDAAQDFNVTELKNIEEMEFWRIMLSELLGNPTRQFNYQENYEPYIQYYPPILRQRLGIIAADRAIAAKDYNGALKIFDQLNEHKLISEVADYINYLMGKIALETQTPDDGYKIWNDLMFGSGSEFVKVRAEFSLIVEQLKRQAISEEDAINRLERLAIRWRGDNLELAVLTSLSNIYKEQKDWPNAIRIWRSLNEAFPNTVEAVDASRRMSDAFIAMFDRGETGKVGGLELMFLYNEFRDLIPTDEVGDRIVDNLTTQMVRMDMMEQAEQLLDQRMRYRFEHQTRSKVGAKLARVYMLNKKPEKALEALQLSVFGVLPESLLRDRTHIAAEALLALNKYDDLFLLLGDEKTQQANAYRMQAYWQSKDWKAMTEAGEAILKDRINPTAELTQLEVNAIIKLAFGYVALGETEQLKYLRDYFTALMKGKEHQKTFEYLTRPYAKLTTKNFEQVMKWLDDTKIFIMDMKKEDFGKPVPAEDNSTAEKGAAPVKEGAPDNQNNG